jgi:diguanylate cyclase (GGDEF)-like protein/PAS domain S-box-containing protein
MHRRLQLQTEDFGNIINQLDVAIWILNLQNQAAFFSDGFKTVFGRAASEFYQDDQLWLKSIHPDDLPIALNRKAGKKKGEKIIDEYRILLPSGEIRWVQDRAIPIQDDSGKSNIYMGIIIDISERKKTEEQIKYLAYHDELTGLANRKLFNDRLDQAILAANANQDNLAIMFIDLDQFKMVNDTLGHNFGDLLLKEVATRLTSCIREVDLVARQSGDEFILLIKNVSTKEADTFAKKILKSLDFPFMLGGNELFITASIGISLFPQHGTDAHILIKNADAAMYDVKYNGKNHFRYYSFDIEKSNQRRMMITNGLHKAIENKEFELYYQPKIDIYTNSVIGVEALIRWKHPIYGPLPPSEFIPIAEETGLILPIGEWVFRKACEHHKRWERLGIAPYNICINVSPRQFSDEQLHDKITKVLKDYDFRPNYLELEITESVAMNNIDEAIDKLNQFKELGVKLALDDFGTGFSSLNYLRSFPIDLVKIDRSFIKDILNNSQNASIVSAIIDICHSLKLIVVAEGVESIEQLEYLRTHSCDVVQGYYFCKPVPLDEIERILRDGLRTESS